MTQKEKQLLIKDFCARLPYSVWGLHRGEDLPLYAIDNSGAHKVLGYNAWFDLDANPFKPYLRPMSSMTEEEHTQYMKLIERSYNDYIGIATTSINQEQLQKYLDFIYSHHFDFNDLITMELALEAPEGMYK